MSMPFDLRACMIASQNLLSHLIRPLDLSSSCLFLLPLINPCICSSGYTDHPVTSMRNVIAKRLTQSKQTSPHGYCTAASRVDYMIQFRKDFTEKGVKVRTQDPLALAWSRGAKSNYNFRSFEL